MKSNPNFLERRCYAEITFPPSFVLFTMFQCPFPDIEEAGAGLGGGEAGFSAGGGVAGFEGGEAGFAGSTLGGGGAGFGAGGWLLGFDPVGGLFVIGVLPWAGEKLALAALEALWVEQALFV